MHLATSSSWPRQNSPTNAARNKHTNTPERTILQNEYQGHRKDVPIIPITKGTPSFKSRLVTERGRAQTHPCMPPLACLKTRKKNKQTKNMPFRRAKSGGLHGHFFQPSYRCQSLRWRHHTSLPQKCTCDVWKRKNASVMIYILKLTTPDIRLAQTQPTAIELRPSYVLPTHHVKNLSKETDNRIIFFARTKSIFVQATS